MQMVVVLARQVDSEVNMLTPHEARLIALAAHYRKAYQDSNPDIGNDHAIERHISHILTLVDLPVTDEHIAEAAREYYNDLW